jgi:hypothetical protein
MSQLLRSLLIPNCGSSCMQSHRPLNKRACQHIKQLGMLVDLPANAQAASVEAQATCCCLLSPAVPAAWFGAVGSHQVAYVLGQSSSFESGHDVSNLDRRAKYQARGDSWCTLAAGSPPRVNLGPRSAHGSATPQAVHLLSKRGHSGSAATRPGRSSRLLQAPLTGWLV